MSPNPSFIFALKNNFKIAAIAVLCGIIFSLNTQTALAYDNDTHFWLTYYLARKAGYSNLQATQIASANVSVDFDKHTQPVTPSPKLKNIPHLNSHFQFVRWQYHALPWKSNIYEYVKPEHKHWWNPTMESDEALQEAADKVVAKRGLEFWKKTLADKQNPGFFLHYLGDSFAHRGFASYIGHAGYYRVDFLASDRTKAHKMALETLKYLVAFREVFAGNKSAEEVEDTERIVLSDFMSEKDLLEVNQTVEKFCDINPSDGAVRNELVDKWDNLSDDTKRSFKLPPRTFVLAFIRVAKNGESPDSRKARELVKNITNTAEKEMPYVWVYDYNKSGTLGKPETKRALTYSDSISTGKHSYANEKANFAKANDNSIRGLCLPFQLVHNDAANPGKCR